MKINSFSHYNLKEKNLLNRLFSKGFDWRRDFIFSFKARYIIYKIL